MHCVKDKMTVKMEIPGAKVQSEDGGSMTMGYMQFDAGIDFAPLLAGLPDDLCHCEHWGYCFDGELIVKYKDGTEERIGAGETYHLPPGHTLRFEQKTSYVEYSPTDDLNEVLAHVGSKLG
jgi:ethanolamine utilization protein EutQ (cupin superfamily)